MQFGYTHVYPMTSSCSRSFEPSGARARFAAAFTAMRLLWLMTSVVSGS